MSTDRPATTDPAEVAPVHTGGNAEDCPACDGRSDLPYPWICPGKDLTASGREFAVRASEPNRKCPLGLRHVNCSCAEPEQPWDEAGCSRSCRNGHTRRWGACAYGKEPAPTLHRFETGVAADGYVSGGHEPMTAEQVAEWLRVQGYAVAPRASEAPGDDGSPTPDVGAVRGREGGSAAESEPRPVDLAFAALGKWFHNTTPGAEYTYTGHTDDPADCGICWEAAEKATEAAAPLIRAAERELVAAQIEAVFVLARRDQSPAEAKADAYRTAAAIARGDQ